MIIKSESPVGGARRLLETMQDLSLEYGLEINPCREPDLNRRTPARLDPESSAVDQAWLSLHARKQAPMIIMTIYVTPPEECGSLYHCCCLGELLRIDICRVLIG